MVVWLSLISRLEWWRIYAGHSVRTWRTFSVVFVPNVLLLLHHFACVDAPKNVAPVAPSNGGKCVHIVETGAHVNVIWHVYGRYISNAFPKGRTGAMCAVTC